MVGFEGGGEHPVGFDAQPGEELGIGAGDPGGSAAQPVAVRVLPDRDEDFPNRGFDAGQVDDLVDRNATEPAVDQPGCEIVQLGEVIVRLGDRAVVGGGAQRAPSPAVASLASTVPAVAWSLADARCEVSSLGVSTGGRSEGRRLPKPLNGNTGWRFWTPLTEAGHVLLRDRLLLDQFEHDRVEHVTVFDEDLPRLVVGELDEGPHLEVDLGGDRVGVVAWCAPSCGRGMARPGWFRT